MKTTKKWNKIFLVGMLGMALNGIVLMGCASSDRRTIVYAPEQPEYEQSVFTFGDGATFTEGFPKGSFDGNEVKWRSESDTIFIPSGSHTLVYNYSSYGYNTASWAFGLRITYDFKPGYAYRAGVKVVGKSVYPVIEEIGMLLWKLPPVSNEPTEFEGTWESEDGEIIVFSGNTMAIQGKSKFVFTFTDKTMVQHILASSGIFARKYITDYEFKDDGGLALNSELYFIGSRTFYKKK